MENTSLELGDIWQPAPPPAEGETVCAALTRYENTLRDAIREIRLDVSTFKLAMERRLEETASLGGPLEAAVDQLQQENRQLRSQLEALNRQVEHLMVGFTLRNNQQERGEVSYGRGEVHTHSPVHHHLQASTQSPSGHAALPVIFSSSPITRVSSTGTSSPSVTRFSSRATFSVCSKSSSIEGDDPIEIDPALPPLGQNGNSATTEHVLQPEGNFPPPSQSQYKQTAPVAMQIPHQPITAITKTAEAKTPSGALPTSSISQAFLSDQAAASTAQPRPIQEPPIQPASFVNTWTTTPVQALGPPRPPEKANSAPAKSVTYSGFLQHDMDEGMPRSVGERRRELVRSQTLPRNIGAQARRSLFERLDSEASHSCPKPLEFKSKLKRSQSFGVSSASSIKQILLEWCRSKTLGYQNISIQNFSSSWSDGLAFCALLHSFFPTEFDYNSLSPAHRQHNFELAFGTAEAKAGCDRLIEVEDMMVMGLKPDPMCVFTYVQSLYNHLRRLE